MAQKILVVDDDEKTVDLVKMYLQRDRYEVLTASDGRLALEVARQRHPDLIILDWMLPTLDGMDICRILRSESEVPIIMLTAKSTETEKLTGLEQGADDYLTKPFSPRELVARVRVVLRRMAQKQEPEFIAPLHLGNILVDFIAHEAWRNDEPLHLTPKEFKLFETLAREPGRAFSRSDLVAQVFGMDYEGLERTVDAHMMNLRKKIELQPDQPEYLLTVYGVGYKLRIPDDIT